MFLNTVCHSFCFSKELLDPFPTICSIPWNKPKTEQQIWGTVTFSLSCYEQLQQTIRSLSGPLSKLKDKIQEQAYMKYWKSKPETKQEKESKNQGMH